MEPQGVERKLTAILSADVAGYSRLMADDEAATVETLTRYRRVFADTVERHDGRVVDSPGASCHRWSKVPRTCHGDPACVPH